MEDTDLIILVYSPTIFAHCFAKQNIECDLKSLIRKLQFVTNYKKLDLNVMLSIVWKFCSKAEAELYQSRQHSSVL